MKDECDIIELNWRPMAKIATIVTCTAVLSKGKLKNFHYNRNFKK